ncbi:MAG: PDZ domain-containing protein [Candidatus Limnocylindrales bacterium]
MGDPRARQPGVRRRGDGRWRRAGHVRDGVRRVAGVPWSRWSADRRQRRAHRAARTRVLGGALLDVEGRLVGLNTNRIGEGFYLALPADAALRTRIEALGRGESAERPRLGVAIAPNHVARRLRRSVGLAERDGILVRGVEDRSLADAAGVEAGDLIVSAGGRPIADADDLHDALGALDLPFELGLVRGAEDRSVTVGATKGRTPGDA